jgi:hypothetical protein
MTQLLLLLSHYLCRFSSDTSMVDDSLPFILNILLANAVSLAGLLAVVLLGQPLLAALLLPLGIAYRCAMCCCCMCVNVVCVAPSVLQGLCPACFAYSCPAPCTTQHPSVWLAVCLSLSLPDNLHYELYSVLCCMLVSRWLQLFDTALHRLEAQKLSPLYSLLQTYMLQKVSPTLSSMCVTCHTAGGYSCSTKHVPGGSSASGSRPVPTVRPFTNMQVLQALSPAL